MNREFPPDSGPESGFAPTSPPLEPNLEVALLLVRLGIKTLQVSLIDLAARTCDKRWNINELGKSALVADDGSFDPSLPTVMGSIAQLEHTPATGILSRQLGPRLWAFAWRVDAHRVVVTEAYFRLAHAGLPESDARLLRSICNGGLQLPVPTDTAPGDLPAAPANIAGSGAAQRTRPTPLDPLAVAPASAAADTPNRRRTPLRIGMLVLVVLCLAAAAIFGTALRGLHASEREVLRLRGQADAVMSMRLGEVLRGGDYGEVQAELEAFAALKYFERAIVTNAQHRVIAVVGPIEGVRIGNGVPGGVVGGARVLALTGAGQTSGPELMVWDAEAARGNGWVSQRTGLIGGLVLSVVAAAAALWMLLRHRRSDRRAPRGGEAAG
ncbi:hypothetical protein [Piscinibacter koreensis]|uniref:Uncharacterized protein n=1 Tax=Piscinibacter koreensis TaxID=2742824 RepID=A0A7Y6TVA7_9BURK|nr:hypothetical protein [Schlegelella koreensis]NUZ04761.1 hypothetical protein [Schlegelella koreensis]